MTLKQWNGFERCEASLSNTGKIQPFGAIIRIERSTGNITHISKNIHKFLSKQDILTERAENVFTDKIWSQISNTPPDKSVNASLSDYNIFGMGDETGWTLELEHKSPSHILNSLTVLKSYNSKAEALQQILSNLIENSNFDRAMYFEFLPDRSGYVKGEICNSNSDRYLNLRYPATDIPEVARILYMNARYRYIYDTTAEPVAIESASGYKPESFDLSQAYSRSISPFHIEYMKNMGIQCALSFPVVIHKKLVGLFSLHNPSPLFISHKDRIALANLAKSYAIFIAKTESEERLAFIDKHHRLIQAYCNWLLIKQEYNPQLQNIFLEMTGAKEVCFNISGKWRASSYGLVDKGLDAIVSAVWKKNDNGVLVTDCLTQSKPELPPISTEFAGVLCVWFTHLPTRCKVTIIFTKPEITQEVTWGSKVEFYPGAINPINSFGQWRELMHGHSEAWSHSANLIAKSLFHLGRFFKKDHPLYQ